MHTRRCQEKLAEMKTCPHSTTAFFDLSESLKNYLSVMDFFMLHYLELGCYGLEDSTQQTDHFGCKVSLTFQCPSPEKTKKQKKQQKRLVRFYFFLKTAIHLKSFKKYTKRLHYVQHFCVRFVSDVSSFCLTFQILKDKAILFIDK